MSLYRHKVASSKDTIICMDMSRKIFLHGQKEKDENIEQYNNEQTATDQQASVANLENENNEKGSSSEDSEELGKRDLSKNLKPKTVLKPIKFVNLIDRLIERSAHDMAFKKEDKLVRRPSMPFRIG